MKAFVSNNKWADDSSELRDAFQKTAWWMDSESKWFCGLNLWFWDQPPENKVLQTNPDRELVSWKECFLSRTNQ